MSRLPFVAACVFLTWAFCVCPNAIAAPDRLVQIDGRVVEDTITAVDAQGRVSCVSSSTPIELDALRRIQRPAAAGSDKPAPVEVVLIDGSAIRAKDVSFDGRTFAVHWKYGDRLELPLAAVGAVRLGAMPDVKPDAHAEAKPDAKSDAKPESKPAGGPTAFDESLRQPEVKQDELYAVVEGSIQVVRGGLQKILPGEVLFIWNDAERKVLRSKVHGVVLARTGPRPDLAGRCRIRLRDGSSLWTAVKGMDAGRLQVRFAADLPLALPWDDVCQIDVRSARVAFLSDLDPAEAVHEPLVTYPAPWRRDRNVLGGPLVLLKTEYEKGLGVHSRSRLVFRVDGKYDVFAAVIGIDAGTAGKGDCVFRVEADGKEIFARRMRGTDEPAPVRLSIARAERLALLVEWGEDLDLADRADWCDARLIREKPGP
jgi:hypothetical protein